MASGSVGDALYEWEFSYGNLIAIKKFVANLGYVESLSSRDSREESREFCEVDCENTVLRNPNPGQVGLPSSEHFSLYIAVCVRRCVVDLK